LAGCSGGNSVTAALARDSAFQNILTSPANAAEGGQRVEGGQREGHKGPRGEGMARMKAFLDSGCATKTGTPKEGGQLTFNNCTGEHGSINGTITWSAPVEN